MQINGEHPAMLAGRLELQGAHRAIDAPAALVDLILSYRREHDLAESRALERQRQEWERQRGKVSG